MKWKEGDPAPDFSLADLGSGKAVRLSDHRGRGVVILEFWAPWCDICKTHLGNLARLQDGWRGRGVTVLSVAVNFRDEAELRQVACEKGVNFPVLPDGALEVAGRYGITGCLPLMVLVDAKGVVRYSHFGEFEGGDGPRRRIEALLSEVASPVPFSWRGEYCNGS
jgi:peroxiredoxin